MKGIAFFEAAAQIIPLLLILLAFQAQPFARDQLSKWAYWIVLIAFTGETAALVALYAEETGALFLTLVSLVLILLGALVFLAIVLAPSGGLLSMRQRASEPPAAGQ